MARPRKPPKPARRRDYAAEYERRQRRARERGFGSYYEQRVQGTRPGTPERAKARGHRSRADFLAALGEGDLIILPFGITSVEFDDDARDGEGAYVEIVKLVVDAETGTERTYTLRNLTRDELVETIEAEQAAGAVFSPSPSLDQRRLVTSAEAAGGYEQGEGRER